MFCSTIINCLKQKRFSICLDIMNNIWLNVGNYFHYRLWKNKKNINLAMLWNSCNYPCMKYNDKQSILALSVCISSLVVCLISCMWKHIFVEWRYHYLLYAQEFIFLQCYHIYIYLKKYLRIDFQQRHTKFPEKVFLWS